MDKGAAFALFTNCHANTPPPLSPAIVLLMSTSMSDCLTAEQFTE